MVASFSLKKQTNDLKTILKDLRYDMINLLRWFKENSMKANPKKFQFMILGKTSRQSNTLKINQIKVKESQKVLLTIDNQLTFKDHVDILRSTANKYLTLCIEKNKEKSNSGKSKVAIQCIYKQPI